MWENVYLVHILFTIDQNKGMLHNIALEFAIREDQETQKGLQLSYV
jgi:hypothetical protein